MNKPRRFDLSPDNFIAGVAGQMNAVELGVYWLMCLLFYSHAGKFDYDEERFLALLPGTHWRTFRAAFSRLQECGKVSSSGGHVTVKGCSGPLDDALKRVSRAVENGIKGGRPPIESNDLHKPDGFYAEKLARAPPSLPPSPSLPFESPNGLSSSKPQKGDFEGFWIHCPKKVGKGAAKKAYARAVLRTAPETIEAGIVRYAASRAGEPEQFTVHPVTWLNADRWLDEASKPNGVGDQPSGAYKARLARLAEIERQHAEKAAKNVQG